MFQVLQRIVRKVRHNRNEQALKVARCTLQQYDQHQQNLHQLGLSHGHLNDQVINGWSMRKYTREV